MLPSNILELSDQASDVKSLVRKQLRITLEAQVFCLGELQRFQEVNRQLLVQATLTDLIVGALHDRQEVILFLDADVGKLA